MRDHHIYSLIPQTFVGDAAKQHEVLRHVIDRAVGRKHVVFSDPDEEAFAWDGRAHSMTLLAADGSRFPTDSLTLPRAPAGEPERAWVWAVLAGGLAILVALWWSRRVPPVS